jgi:hypothetical protein
MHNCKAETQLQLSPARVAIDLQEVTGYRGFQRHPATRPTSRMEPHQVQYGANHLLDIDQDLDTAFVLSAS